MKNLILSMMLLGTICGCSTIVVAGDAQLASSDAICTKVKEKRVWYVLWGLVPITSNDISSAIPKNAAKIRVETKYNIVDILVGAVLGNFTVTSKTAEIYVCQ